MCLKGEQNKKDRFNSIQSSLRQTKTVKCDFQNILTLSNISSMSRALKPGYESTIWIWGVFIKTSKPKYLKKGLNDSGGAVV